MSLQEICAERGVEYRDCGNGHIQLKGPLLVNYYPESKFMTAYVAGTKKSVKRVHPDQAVDMCFEAPVCQGVKDSRSKNTRRQRMALHRKINKCHWCGIPLTIDTSTLEHKIPLGRGGLDNANNRTLACEPCNRERGSDMPELEKENE